MRKRIGLFCIAILAISVFSGCSTSSDSGEVKIGVSMGVGAAARWDSEKTYMEARAEELGAEIEVRLNRTDTPKTQIEDCIELIDSGIDVLVLTPRDATNTSEILTYAKEKKVPVVCYSRSVVGESVDLFVGYDCSRIGQKQGQYLSELVVEGDYILLQGDSADNNATLLYEGAMRYINPIKDNLNILLDTPIAGWSPDEAKKLVKEAIAANGNKVDAILAPNDTLAGACAEVIQELGITDHVIITGMDAELDAIQRIVSGKQDVTFYMDLKELATTCINEAYHIATNQTVNLNAEFDNESDSPIPSNLMTGQLITKENLDKVLIDSGYYTKEQIYSEE